MPAIVEFPQVVREAVDELGELLSCEPQRRHFAEYLTGLMVATNKTVTGINGEFAETTRKPLQFLSRIGLQRPDFVRRHFSPPCVVPRYQRSTMEDLS